MPYRRILLGTDGSGSAARAELAARRLAGALGAELRVVHATDDVAAREWVRAVETAQAEGVAASGATVPGSAKVVLLEEARRWLADLLVVGDRGMQGVRSVALGSVPDAISHDATNDVLIVRTDRDRESGHGRYARVLVATDGTPTADRAVWRGADLARLFGSALDLAFVGHPVTGRNVLEDTAGGLEGITAGKYLLQGEPGAAITEAAEALDADLIVVGSKGMRRGKRLPGGSVPNRLSHRASKDVLIVRTHRKALRDVAPGEGAIVEEGGRELAVVRDESGERTVLSATCRHLGCTVDWNPIERTWDCPCHGSRYNADGSLLRGPATEGLPRVEVDG